MLHTLAHPYPVRVTALCQSTYRNPGNRDLVTRITCDVGEEFTAIALAGSDTTIIAHGELQLEIPSANIIRIAALTSDNRVAI